LWKHDGGKGVISLAGSRWVAVLLVAGLAGATAACSSRVGGEPAAATTVSSAPQEPSAENLLGDLTTIDPCSLTDPAVFQPYGTATFATPESLDYCAVTVTPGAGIEVIVTIGELGELSESPELEGKHVRELDDGLFVAERDNTTGFCAHALVFTDEVTLDVASSTYQGTAPDTCPMIDAAMNKVVEVIEGDGVEHRSPEPDSLMSVDPCSLIDDAAITALPGLTGALRREYPGHHQCYWETSSAQDRMSVRLVFGAGAVPTPYGTGANKKPIAGRASVTNPIPDAGAASFCTVDTGHIPFDEVDGQTGMVELASVFARMPKGKVKAACQVAVAVATAVWPRLPTP
jgi:hypothetical protein